MSREFQIIHHTIDEGILKTADARLRNQLIGCMHAHNELMIFNRILTFSLNDTGDGELHDAAKSVQMWSILQILSAKLVETWKMLNERFLAAQPEDPALSRLEGEIIVSLEWLKSYFGTGKKLKSTSLLLIRDQTAFHYDKLNLRSASENLADRERAIYLAQQPVNSLYYVGSALVFRTIFKIVAENAGNTASDIYEESVKKGSDIAIEDATSANYHMHMLLYGLIKSLLESLLGCPLETLDEVRINVADAPKPGMVGLPNFIDIGNSN